MPAKKPFKIRCPHKACQKYMLIETSAIKGKIKCLVCKKEFQVGSSNTQKQSIAENAKEPTTTSSGSLVMMFCPRCESSYAIPSTGNQKNCPECGQQL